MKVSIIIPFYNASNYIITCINCLKKQKHKNFEALFINDGSDDDWHNLFNNEKDERMFSITIKKGGVSKARNEGIKIATGELITFLDIDDEYTPDFISNIVEKYKNDNYDICFCNYIEIYNNGNKIIKKIKNLNNDNLKLELISKLLGKKKQNEKLDEMFGSVWRCAFSKTFLVKNNLLFDTNITIAEDLLFIIKSIIKAKTISFIDKELYLYYIRANSTLNSYKTNKFDSDIILHFEIRKELTNASLFKGDIIDRFLYNNFRMYTTSISNLARCNNKKIIKLELNKIFTCFSNDENIKELNIKSLSKLEHIIYVLFKLKLKKITFLLFRTKEKIRLSKIK